MYTFADLKKIEKRKNGKRKNKLYKDRATQNSLPRIKRCAIIVDFSRKKEKCKFLSDFVENVYRSNKNVLWMYLKHLPRVRHKYSKEISWSAALKQFFEVLTLKSQNYIFEYELMSGIHCYKLQWN